MITFKTFPPSGASTSFKFGLGSCTNLVVPLHVYKNMLERSMDFFLHIGDFIYAGMPDGTLFDSPDSPLLLGSTLADYQGKYRFSTFCSDFSRNTFADENLATF